MFALIKLFFVFFLFLGLIVLFVVVGFVVSLYNLLTGKKNGSGATFKTYRYTTGGTQQSDSSQSDSAQPDEVIGNGPAKKGKIIPPDEGEYVEFEEVK